MIHSIDFRIIRSFSAILVAAIVLLIGSASTSFGQIPAPNGDNGVIPSADANNQPIDRSNEHVIASKRLIDVIRTGGPLMIPIGICSVILLVFVFERSIYLRKGRIIPRPFVKRFMQQVNEGTIDRDEALELCEKNKSHIATVFAAGAKKWGKPSVEIEQAVLDAGERVSNELRKYLRLINGIATVCPLLGLLGTVLGMIHAFDAIATVDPTQADPKVMIATGISQALLTTAAGMSVAIPAIIAYLFFVSRADRRVVEIDALGQQLVHEISLETITEQNTERSKSRTRKKRVA